MNKLIRLSKSSISNTEKNSVLMALDKEFLGMGEETNLFERKLTEFFGREVVCVNTGTSALQLALQAVGIGRGDEVLVQSLTYVASFQAISATGAIPIPCEIYEDTLTINLNDAQKRITKNTKAIMPVHYSGKPGDLNSIYEFAGRNNLRVIEDAAHAFGSEYNENRIGSFGDIACFSFDGIKNITSGEGGCIVSDDTQVLDKIKDLRLLGVEKDTEKRYSGQRSWDFNVKSQGWRYHMSNIMASIGIAQLERFPEMARKRIHLYKKYNQLLANIPNIILPGEESGKIVPHIFPIRITKSKINRDDLRNKLLKDDSIETGVHYKPNHTLDFFRSKDSQSLPITEKVYSELLSLPLHIDLTDEDIEKVAFSLLKYI